jgi:outer membrane receptor protein involved in Fe transport
LWGVFAFVFLLAVINESVQAQVLFGSLVGNVTDASGAAVPGASVKVTETTTNNVFNVQTNDSGTYTVPNVPAGTYQVEVSKEGFRTFVTTNIVVNQNNEVRVDASMQVGAQVEKVEVTAQAAALQTDRADIHSEVATQQLENLPQANRTYEGLFELVPGSTPPNGQLQGGTNNPSKSMSFSMNGSGVSGPNVRIEGVSARNPWVTNYTTFVPSVEAIQDVNVVTNAAEAEQGIADGASVNVRLKSGTNGFHGAGFEYNIGAYSEANNFFAPYGSKPPHLVDNDTGGNAGGPIIRDKLFYFGSYEGDYNDSAVSGILSLPNATELSGNESASPNPIYNPYTGDPKTGKGRTAFPGNIVPASMFDPVVVKLLPHFPSVTYPNLPLNNDFVNQAQVYNLHKIDTKIDYTATQKLRISGRYGYQPYYNVQQPIYGQYLGGSGGFASAGAGNYLQHGATLAVSGSATYIVNPTFVVDATFGVTQGHQLLFPTNANERQGQELGIPGANTGPLPWAGGLPNFAIANFVTLGYSYPALEYKDPIFEYQANGTKTSGAHTIRFGFDIVREHQNHIEVRPTVFTFSGNATAVNAPNAPSPNEWNSMADFLLGTATTLGNYVQFVYPLTLRTWNLAFYGQDQWQVNRKLTVNLGVRWEHYPVPTQANRGINYYDPNTDIIEECGVAGISGNCGIHVSNKLFAPSVGFAYRLFEDFVIRAGYSLAPQPDSMGRSGVQSYPDEAQSTVNGANSYAVAGTVSGTGAPVIPQATLVNGTTLVPANTGNLFWNPANFIRGYIQSYNFTIQKQFAGGITTQIGYVGAHGVHLFTNENINYGQIGGGAASQTLYKYGITASSTENLPVLSDKYNSLQASVRKSLSAGLHFQGAFTYQHDIGIQSLSSSGSSGGAILIPQYFSRNDYTTNIDRTFNVSVSADYELPFGKGKQFVKSGPLSYVVGGWNINGIFTHFSGLPFSVFASSASCNCPGNTQTANLVMQNVAIIGNGLNGQPYFNPLAYAPVTTAAFGTGGFNQLRGPGATNLDASVFRNFSVTERIKLQFRIEALNATNTPHFANPGTTVSNVQYNPDGSIKNLNGFDQITSTAQISRLVDPRYLRLGVRITF